MATEETENNIDVLRQQNKRKRTLRMLLAAGCVLLILAVTYLIFWVYKINHGTFTNYSVKAKIEREDGSVASFTSYDGQLLKYSRDGASAIKTDGTMLWNGSYEMNSPIVSTCDDYAVIGDQGSKSIIVFNKSGLVNQITVDQPILAVSISKQGVVAVLMQNEESNYIVLYDSSNKKQLVTANIPVEKSGYALDLALSNDGTKLVMPCMDLSTGMVRSSIGFYNFSEVGANASNHFMGGFTLDDTFVPKVDFLDNTTVAIYGDQGFWLYEMEQKPADEPIVKEQFKKQVVSTFSSDSYIGFVLANGTGKKKYQVVAYDKSGNKVLDEETNFEYSNISMSGSEILFYNYSECMIMNVKGKIRFQYKFKKSIESMFGSSEKRYYVVFNDKIEVIKLKEAK